MNRELANCQSPNGEFEGDAGPEETLRLLAQLPPPDALEDRVHSRVRLSLGEERRAASRLRSFLTRAFFHPVRPRAPRLQLAAASLLAVALAASGWGVYRARTAAPAPQMAAPATPGSFGSAKAERVPPTLKPLKVPQPPRKKADSGGGKGAASARH